MTSRPDPRRPAAAVVAAGPPRPGVSEAAGTLLERLAAAGDRPFTASWACEVGDVPPEVGQRLLSELFDAYLLRLHPGEAEPLLGLDGVAWRPGG